MGRIKGIVSFRCSDIGFNDFPESFYDEAILYANRKVARKYSLINRWYAFTATAIDDNQKRVPITLRLHSFTAESLVMINGVEYTRADNLRLDSAENEYQLSYGVQDYLFNYTHRGEEDNIQIFYTADITVDDFDDESIMPVVNSRYDDEVIKYALIYIAEAGVAKFGGATRDKFLTIYKLNTQKREGTESGEKETWPTIKVFKVI